MERWKEPSIFFISEVNRNAGMIKLDLTVEQAVAVIDGTGKGDFGGIGDAVEGGVVD